MMVLMRLSRLVVWTTSSAFTIFKDKMTAIEMCVARFDEDTKESFIDLYTKVDAGVMTSENTEEKEEETENEF